MRRHFRIIGPPGFPSGRRTTNQLQRHLDLRPSLGVSGPLGLTILVVEDHLDTLRSMKLLLTRLGYDVLSAENMTDALRIASTEEFDILLSDIGLPDGSGHELMRRIRETRSVPALALSGFGMDEDLQRSLDAGFSAHLTKPVSLDRLQSAIADLEA